MATPLVSPCRRTVDGLNDEDTLPPCCGDRVRLHAAASQHQRLPTGRGHFLLGAIVTSDSLRGPLPSRPAMVPSPRQPL